MTKAFKAKENVAYYMVAPLKRAGPSSSVLARYSMLTQSKVDKLKLALPSDGLIKGNSVELLHSIVRAKRTLEAKHMQLLKIRRMNTDAELAKAFGDMVPEDFQKRYASLVLGLEKMNRELQDNLNLLQSNSQKHIDTPDSISFLTPRYFI